MRFLSTLFSVAILACGTGVAEVAPQTQLFEEDHETFTFEDSGETDWVIGTPEATSWTLGFGPKVWLCPPPSENLSYECDEETDKIKDPLAVGCMLLSTTNVFGWFCPEEALTR